MKIKAVLFDFDMTLVDSSYVITECTNRLADAKGLRKITRAELMEVIGLELEDAWRVLWGEVGPDWVDYYRANFRDVEIGGMVEFRGTRELPALLKSAGIKVGVVSNRRYARLAVERAGLAHLFDVIVGLEDVERGKPEPDSILYALDSFGVQPEEAVYVGDTDLDMNAARAARALGVGMTTGNFGEEPLLRAGAGRVCSCLMEIPGAIGLKLI